MMRTLVYALNEQRLIQAQKDMRDRLDALAQHAMTTEQFCERFIHEKEAVITFHSPGTPEEYADLIVSRPAALAMGAGVKGEEVATLLRRYAEWHLNEACMNAAIGWAQVNFYCDTSDPDLWGGA